MLGIKRLEQQLLNCSKYDNYLLNKEFGNVNLLLNKLPQRKMQNIVTTQLNTQ